MNMPRTNSSFALVMMLLCAHYFSFAQHATLNTTKKEVKAPFGKHKVMIIPFEPKMYMSEIDMYINQETKQNARQIKWAFRDGVNEQLYKALKSKYGVVDLLDDTVKTKKDLEMTYQYLGYEFMKVPNQDNYKPPVKEKEEKAIEKGQIMVETNTDTRFMNAKIKNPKLVPYLFDKYKCDLFIFINQLDIKGNTSGGPAETPSTSGNRKLVVHYTIYTYDAIELNSGIAEEEFPVKINTPKKINGDYLAKVAQLIAGRLDKALTPLK
jgi:hypothetical protein